MTDAPLPASHTPGMSRPITDATPAYRGYRRQTLYILARILDATSEGLTFQPEGVEDLAIYDDDRLVEAVQVKSLDANVTLSDLVSVRHPNGSFFHRAVSLVSEHPSPLITLASFGPVGPQLTLALAGEESARTEISRKLIETYGFTPEDASSVLQVLVAKRVEERTLTDRIFEFLRNSVTATDPEAAFDLLCHWLYGCAERKCRLSRPDVIDRINRVGRFTAERAAHHSVWFSSVMPIEDRTLDPTERDALRAEFYRGVGARYDHVLADVDVDRPEKLQQISAAFAERNIVILHAASGQGKSTLAFRYMRQELQAAWRYHVGQVNGRQHAQVIATALEGYADALGVPIAVFVDVSPRDIGWPDLVERLALHQSIRMMVAVREEDWRQATFVDTDVFQDVALDFNRAEAEDIYCSLVELRVPPTFLDFEEAWTRFGEDGPLLEFVYLVTQGGLLRERLAGQICTLKRAANNGQRSAAEIDLLRLVSLAAAFGGRLSVKSLASHVRLPALDEAIVLLEKEYLLRRAQGGSLIEGLHPIRSEILVGLLTDRDIAPWSDAAATVLKLLDERDIGSFLLHAFSRRRPDFTASLDELATFQPTGWVGVAGVLRALIWLGLREYADANAELIGEARRDAGPGWLVVMDTDIANAMPDSARSLLESLGNLTTTDRISQIRAFRTRQTPKDDTFVHVTTWLRSRTDPPALPSDADDWIAAATVAFWIGRLDVDWPLTDWLPTDETVDAAKSLPIEAAADLVVGLAEGYGGEFSAWLEGIRPALQERFQRELMSPVVVDDGTRVTAHFLVSTYTPSEATKSWGVKTLDAENPLHNEALVRVNLLRRFFPDREAYGCRGYGHGATLLQLPSDDTRKVSIPRFRLPLRWQTSVNATFGGIVAYNTRAADWAEYAKVAIVLREEVVRCLRDLKKALPGYLRSFRPLAVSVPSGAWYKTWFLVRDLPGLPRCAVDEWGFVYESLADAADEQAQLEGRSGLGQIPAVRRYRPILQALRSYARPLENFLLQAPAVISANRTVRKQPTNARMKKGSGAEDQGWEEDNERRVSVQNLAEAWMALTEMQQRYRQFFSTFTDDRRIDALEQREAELFAEVWPLWFAFALQPDRVMDQPVRDAPQLLDRTFRRLQRALRQELRECATAGVDVNVVPGEPYWEADPVLCLTVDGTDAVVVYNIAESALKAVFRAISSVADSELRRYALGLHWKKVVIVPLVHGQSLTGMAWHVDTGMLARARSVEELSWLQILMHSIPQDTLAQLGIGVWDNERLALGTKLVEAANRLLPFVVHMAELSELPEIQGVGEELALGHVDEMMTKVNAVTQSVIDSVVELRSAINDAMSKPQGLSDKSVDLAYEAINEFHQAVLPTKGFQGSATLEVRQFGPWAEQLRGGLRYALIAQLAWSSAVLNSTIEES